MRFFSVVLIFCVFSTGCSTVNAQKSQKTNECVRFRSMMTDLLEPAALYALQEACINSKAGTH